MSDQALHFWACYLKSHSPTGDGNFYMNDKNYGVSLRLTFKITFPDRGRKLHSYIHANFQHQPNNLKSHSPTGDGNLSIIWIVKQSIFIPFKITFPDRGRKHSIIFSMLSVMTITNLKSHSPTGDGNTAYLSNLSRSTLI